MELKTASPVYDTLVIVGCINDGQKTVVPNPGGNAHASEKRSAVQMTETNANSGQYSGRQVYNLYRAHGMHV